MSISAKHSYRFHYLRSEQWGNVRIEALAREKAKCQICGEESISNDAHHIWYPKNIYETTADHLVIMCRACHEFAHAMLPNCKTQNEIKGKAEWSKFRTAVITWRHDKNALFNENKDLNLILQSDLRKQVIKVKEFFVRKANNREPISKLEIGEVFTDFKKLCK